MPTAACTRSNTTRTDCSIPATEAALWQVHADGTRTLVFSDGLVNPTGLASANGNFYVANMGHSTGAGDVLLITAVPEPPAYALMLLGLLVPAIVKRRHRVEALARSRCMASIAQTECLEACAACAAACDHCAASCLQEEDVRSMSRCIALDMDCAAMCRLAAAFIARDSDFAAPICRMCAEVCTACADECVQHPHEHCQACAHACRRCAAACRTMSGGA